MWGQVLTDPIALSSRHCALGSPRVFMLSSRERPRSPSVMAYDRLLALNGCNIALAALAWFASMM